ncbi:hypothetical protein EON65_15010, partial [archaeon]
MVSEVERNLLVTPIEERKDPPPGPPVPPPSPLHQHCGDDLKEFCDKDTGMWDLLCLFEHRKELSEDCKAYIRSTTVGACNSFALQLCPQENSIEDITLCLYNHTSLLSTECLSNLESQKVENPFEQQQLDMLRATYFSVVFAGIIFSLPILLLVCMCFDWCDMYKTQEKVWYMTDKEVKRKGGVIRVVRVCEAPQSPPSPSPLSP